MSPPMDAREAPHSRLTPWNTSCACLPRILPLILFSSGFNTFEANQSETCLRNQSTSSSEWTSLLMWRWINSQQDGTRRTKAKRWSSGRGRWGRYHGSPGSMAWRGWRAVVLLDAGHGLHDRTCHGPLSCAKYHPRTRMLWARIWPHLLVESMCNWTTSPSCPHVCIVDLPYTDSLQVFVPTHAHERNSSMFDHSQVTWYVLVGRKDDTCWPDPQAGINMDNDSEIKVVPCSSVFDIWWMPGPTHKERMDQLEKGGEM